MQLIFNLSFLLLFTVSNSFAFEVIDKSVQLNCLGSIKNSQVSCTITDPDGVVFGYDVARNVFHNYNEGVGDYDSFGKNEFGGELFTDLDKSGTYKINIYSLSNNLVEVAILPSKSDGFAFVSNVSPQVFTFTYSSANGMGNLERLVTKESTLKDLSLVKSMGLVYKDGVFASIEKKIADLLSKDTLEMTDINKLKAVINKLEAQKGKALSENAAVVLIYDLENLIK